MLQHSFKRASVNGAETPIAVYCHDCKRFVDDPAGHPFQVRYVELQASVEHTETKTDEAPA
ncbi:MAG: hypothetical protein NVSMB64_22600 [Candidatus Velthaea sp.]